VFKDGVINVPNFNKEFKNIYLWLLKQPFTFDKVFKQETMFMSKYKVLGVCSMKTQIDLQHCNGKVIKKIIGMGGEQTILWFTDNTFILLEAEYEDEYGDISTCITHIHKLNAIEFGSEILVKAGFYTDNEISKIRQEYRHTHDSKQRIALLKQYRLLKERFGSLDQYKSADFGETETEHFLRKSLSGKGERISIKRPEPWELM